MICALRKAQWETYYIGTNNLKILRKLSSKIDESILSPASDIKIKIDKVPSNINDELNVIAKSKEYPWMQSPRYKGLWNQYKNLSKYRLTSLVVITAMGGYAVAPDCFDLTSFLMCSIGTGLLSSAANAINQYHEVPFDSQMARTKSRVLVTGNVTPLQAIKFAAITSTMGLSILNFGVNDITAVLGLGNLVLYTMCYTPLKRISIVNTWVGSVVGAIPPLMGWTACTGSLNAGAWILAGLLFAWQFPHFNALSWNLRPDYSRAGYRMMAVTNPELCRSTAFRYTVAIAILCAGASLFDVTSAWFVAESLPLNLYFIYLAHKFKQNSDSSSSRTLFLYSLIHLPLLMLLLLFNKKRWIFAENSDTVHQNIITINELTKTQIEDNLFRNPQISVLKKVLPVTNAADDKSTIQTS